MQIVYIMFMMYLLLLLHFKITLKQLLTQGFRPGRS